MNDNSKKTKKLLILIWNLGIGGVQKRMRDVAIDISTNHKDWEIIFLVKNRYPDSFKEQIINLPRVKVIYSPKADVKNNKSMALLWILKQYWLINPNVCLTFMSHFSMLMIFVKHLFFWRRTRLVLNEGVFTSKYLPIHSKHPRVDKFLVKLTYKYADRIIVPTKIIKNELHSAYLVPRKKIIVIPNWTLFPPTKPLKQIYDLIYVGRFENEKGLVGLINVLAKIKLIYPTIKLVLIGEGSQELIIRREIDRLHLINNVKILSTRKDVSPWLKKSKIFMLTSMNEGMPNVVLEAALCEIPTICREFEGVNEVIKNNQTGIIVRSEKEIVVAITKLLECPDIRISMGKAAQNYVKEKFNVDLQNKYINILTS
jgi:glycosyltransferase involved in cell wall biosynthesis